MSETPEETTPTARMMERSGTTPCTRSIRERDAGVRPLHRMMDDCPRCDLLYAERVHLMFAEDGVEFGS
jgi:hypothetical protein